MRIMETAEKKIETMVTAIPVLLKYSHSLAVKIGTLYAEKEIRQSINKSISGNHQGEHNKLH